MSWRSFVSGMLIGSLTFSPMAMAQAAPDPAKQEAANEGPAIVVRSQGLEAMLPDERDAGLRDALKLLGKRLPEIPREMDGNTSAAPPIMFVWDLLTNPLSITIDAASKPNGFPVAVTLMSRGSKASGPDPILSRLKVMLAATGMKLPEADASGLSALPAPAPVKVGITKVGESRAFVCTVGDVIPTDPVMPALLPKGVTPVFELRANLRKLGPLLDGLAQQGGAMAPPLAVLEQMGLIGDSATFVEGAVGYQSDRMVGHAVYHQHWATLQKAGATERPVLSHDVLKHVPADASYAKLSLMPWEMFLNLLDQIEPQGLEKFNTEISRELGTPFDVKSFVGHFGTTAAMYSSPSTGGGLLSSIILVELKNPEALLESQEAILSRINLLGTEEAKGYLRIRSWTNGEQRYFSFTAPGLPIPVEPTWGVVGNVLVLGLSSSSVLPAVARINAGGPSILDNPAVKAMVGNHSASLNELEYYNAPAVAREGYGVLSLGATALGNLVRSPGDPERQPGTIMPSYEAVTKNPRPIVRMGYWDNDDLVYNFEADRSMIVNASTIAGACGGMYLAVVAPLAAAIALPAIGQARASAKQSLAASNVRAIVQGCIVYANEHEDQYPASIQVLIDEHVLEASILDRPIGPAVDGGPNYTIRGGVSNSFFAEQIVAIDRAALVNGEEGISVGFADAHIELLSRQKLIELLALPVNQGAAEALQLPPME